MEKDSIFYIYRALEQKLLIIFGNTIYYTNLPVKTRNWLKTIKKVWIIWKISPSLELGLSYFVLTEAADWSHPFPASVHQVHIFVNFPF